MFDGLTTRHWAGILIVLATGAVVFALTLSVQAALTAAVGGLVGLLAVSAPPEAKVERPAHDANGDEMLDAILDAIVEPVLLVEQGQVTRANRSARALLGEHIVGEDARTAIRHPAATDYLAGAADEAARPVELVGLGTLDQRWEMRATALPGERRVVHLIDRTGSYAAERMRVDFVANASHELRTPLASIIGYVETLADGADEDIALRARFLRIVNDEAHRMERLVEDLMSLSRIEAEKYRLPNDRIDLAALIEEVRASLAEGHGGRGADIAISIGRDLPAIAGDRAQLSQLLHNLLGNAMKYGRAGTAIDVAAAVARPGTVRLTVVDRGDGIAPEHLPRLTERFYRADPGRSRAVGGTGLGLAIVKHIVERHRGRLDITSRLGEGTRVTVTFRVADGAVIMA